MSKKKPVVDAIFEEENPKKKQKLAPMTPEELAEIKRLLTAAKCECSDCEGTLRMILAYEAVAPTPLPPAGKPKKTLTLARFESREERAKREAGTPETPALT